MVISSTGRGVAIWAVDFRGERAAVRRKGEGAGWGWTRRWREKGGGGKGLGSPLPALPLGAS